MQTASHFVQLTGFLAIIASAGLVLTRLLSWRFATSRNAVRLGLELLGCFSLAYLFATPALSLIALDGVSAGFMEAASVLWWLTLAFTLDASIKRFIWSGPRQAPKLLRDGATLTLYGGAIAAIMHFVYGQPITAMAGAMGGAAVIIGLAAQSSLSEVFAGLSLNSTRAVRIGDFVAINDVHGLVHEMNWRSVSLHNPQTDSLHVFANSVVAGGVFLNYNLPTDNFKNPVTFVAEYSASPERVGQLVLDALHDARYVARQPAPDINVLGFTDIGMEYRVRYCFDGPAFWWLAQNEVANTIWSTLRRNGVRLSIDRHKLMSGHEQEIKS